MENAQQNQQQRNEKNPIPTISNANATSFEIAIQFHISQPTAQNKNITPNQQLDIVQKVMAPSQKILGDSPAV